MASTTTEPQGTTLHLTRTTAELEAARVALCDAIDADSFNVEAVTACAQAINLIDACIAWQADNPVRPTAADLAAGRALAETQGPA